jgi:hypothetical protein
MARGWESKSVEIQIEDAGSAAKADEEKPQKAQDAQVEYKREGLKLQRARVLQEMESARNPRYIKMLDDMLKHLDGELEALPEGKIARRK